MKRAAVVLVCLLLLIVPVAVTAHDGDHTETEAHETSEEPEDPAEQEEEQETEQEREVSIDAESDRVKISSSFENETGEREREDEFELDFSVQMDPRIELKAESERETADSESENESEYKVRFRALHEFVDENGNGVYDDGEEVSTYDLSDTAYRQVQHTTEQRDGNTVHVIEATSTDNLFTVRLYVTGDITNINGEQVQPTEVKIDLEMHDYNFEANNSKLALHSEIESETEVSESNRGDEAVVRSSGNDAFFSWKKQAQVDGETTPVKSTRIAEDEEESDDGDYDVYFAYEQGSSIVHDPKIGLSSGGSSGILGFFGGLFAQLAQLFGL